MHRTTLLILLCVAPLLRGADAGTTQRGPLRLSLKRAVELALSPEGNTYIQLAQEGVKQARARTAMARSALLPDIESYAGLQNANRSLVSQGLQEVNLPLGITLPPVVGPFDVMDIRATATQNVFDFSALRRYQSARAGAGAARAESDNASDQVAAQVAKAYLAALRDAAALEAAKADVAQAEAVLKLAEHQKAAGTGMGIEITRARVQLSNEQQRQLVAENMSHRSRLQLLRAMGLRLDTQLELTDRLTYTPVDSTSLEQAEQEALKSRSDFKAQQRKEDSARFSSSASKMERLPTLVSYLDYGTIGGPDAALPTRTIAFQLRVPVFDGGRRDAHRAEAASQYRQEKVRTNDLREQIDLEIRLALDSLRSAEDQVKVAEEGLQLAANELAQAQRRYEAGVANSLEVTDAQTRLERARQNQITALFNHNLSRIDLGQAMGIIRRTIQ